MRTAYSARKRCVTTFTPETGKTVQYFKDQCNINNIIHKHSNGGPLWAVTGSPRYEDFTDIADYQEAQNALIRAQESFQALPSKIRAQFDNDPERFVEYCLDERNIDDLRRMGLAPEAQNIPEELLKEKADESAG